MRIILTLLMAGFLVPPGVRPGGSGGIGAEAEARLRSIEKDSFQDGCLN
jgi:hypothetical protein